MGSCWVRWDPFVGLSHIVVFLFPRLRSVCVPTLFGCFLAKLCCVVLLLNFVTKLLLFLMKNVLSTSLKK
jgi:hypothetical protein